MLAIYNKIVTTFTCYQYSTSVVCSLRKITFVTLITIKINLVILNGILRVQY